MSRAAASLPARERGFTLLETLVTLAVLGLMATLLLGAVRAPTAFALTLRTREARVDAVVGAQARLRSTIENLVPLPRIDSADGAIDVRGSEHDLALFAPPPAGADPGTLRRYRLLLTAGGDLVLYAAEGLDDRIRLDAPDLVGWQPIPLLSGVDGLTISYFGPVDDRRGGRVPDLRWQNRWLDRSDPPRLVRIALRFREGDARVWPELIVRPLATASSACPLDRATGRCKLR